MSATTTAGAGPTGLRGVRRWAPSQRWLRLVVLLGPTTALLATAAAGEGPAPWAVAVVVALSARWAWSPASGAGTLVLLLVLSWWARVPDDALHPVALVAAAALLAAHVAALVSSAAPPRTPVDPAVLRLWVGRGCLLLLVAPVLWVLARALRGEAAPDGLWPGALSGALVVVVALAVAVGPRDEER